MDWDSVILICVRAFHRIYWKVQSCPSAERERSKKVLGRGEKREREPGPPETETTGEGRGKKIFDSPRGKPTGRSVVQRTFS